MRIRVMRRDQVLPPRRCAFALAALAVLSLAGGCGSGEGAKPLDWDMVLASIRENFPGVPQMSTADYAALVRNREPHILVDVREPAEYRVSHIEGAQNFHTMELIASNQIPKDAIVVTYCSVGYRSSALAEKLQKAGYKNVVNLEGSLFKWANEERRIVKPGGGSTTKVHPYSERWATLLDREKAIPSR